MSKKKGWLKRYEAEFEGAFKNKGAEKAFWLIFRWFVTTVL